MWRVCLCEEDQFTMYGESSAEKEPFNYALWYLWAIPTSDACLQGVFLHTFGDSSLIGWHVVVENRNRGWLALNEYYLIDRESDGERTQCVRTTSAGEHLLMISDWTKLLIHTGRSRIALRNAWTALCWSRFARSRSTQVWASNTGVKPFYIRSTSLTALQPGNFARPVA